MSNKIAVVLIHMLIVGLMLDRSLIHIDFEAEVWFFSSVLSRSWRKKKSMLIQTRNQAFFRAGEFSWN